MSNPFDFSDLADVDLGSMDSSFSDGIFSSASDLDLSSIFRTSSGAPLVAPVVNLPLPSGGGGLSALLGNVSALIQTAYQGEAMVNQQKALNKIAEARLYNQLETVRTTPNLWLVLGAGAAGLFAWKLIDRGRE